MAVVKLNRSQNKTKKSWIRKETGSSGGGAGRHRWEGDKNRMYVGREQQNVLDACKKLSNNKINHFQMKILKSDVGQILWGLLSPALPATLRGPWPFCIWTGVFFYLAHQEPKP